MRRAFTLKDRMGERNVSTGERTEIDRPLIFNDVQFDITLDPLLLQFLADEGRR